MFAARLHDPSLATFSRQEAAELIPKTNPFLRKLFGYILGPDIDDRIRWIVDALADLFRATDVAEMLKNFGKATQRHDPIIHFYETFLAEYDPRLRKSRGVWYTPEPVVNFIVRAVDDILKTEFGLAQGLADTSKTTIEVDTQMEDKRSKTGYKREKREVHKVQILDPATGTGTFLAEVVKQIYRKFKGQEGIWSGYVEKHLIPRLNGFELLMASYAMAHLKLDLLLTETGYKPKKEQRLRVYLTNSLEQASKEVPNLFMARWLSEEGIQADFIKRDTPVMVILGNPPYSGESANKGKWIKDLMEDYKKEPGGKEKLKEKNPKWINADEYKFIRFGQHFIEKNGSGMVAFINPHGFLDNPTFRGMRWNLLNTYDKIYIIDLHGNTKKKEVSPDGSADVNVFDIMQGVSINLFIKTGRKKANELGKVFHYDLYGKRELKYKFLIDNSLNSISFKELPNIAPNFFMVQKDFNVQEKYNEGFSISECFVINNVGIVTSRDGFVIDDSIQELSRRISDFFVLDKATLLQRYELRENASWKIDDVKAKAKTFAKEAIQQVNYRPFDNRFLYYEEHFIERSRTELMRHFLNKENFGLMTCRQTAIDGWEHVGITKLIADDSRVSNRSKERGYIFPLYLYPETNGQQSIEDIPIRTPNLNKEIVQQIAEKLSLSFTPEKESAGEVCYANSEEVSLAYRQSFAPIDLLDYIYAVLHSPGYREKYKEFLKIDFPRVPYPEDAETFWQLVKLGGELRKIHLLESPVVEQYISSYPEDGDNTVTRSIGKKDWELYDAANQFGRVWINEEQYFDRVPLVAWEFYIGGYQPAQKWLKDRKGRTLSYEDIRHYQKIIVALTETDRLMKEIGEVQKF